jgi:hypothetical protein
LSSVAATVAAWTRTIASGCIARALWCVIGPEGIEEHELASDLYATIRVDMHDHTQPAVEVMALFRGQIVKLLEGEGLVAGEESVPVTLELDNAAGPPPNLL